MALSKSINLLHAQRAVPCDICEDEIPGKYYCMECKQTLCPQCEKNHKKVAATKNHNIVLRTQVGDIDTTILTCTDHGDQASFHCEKCNIAVCTKCVTGKHRGHNLSDLDDILEKEKKLLQDDVKTLQRALSTLKNQRGEMHTEKKNYEMKIKEILKDMQDENEAIIKELQKIHKEKVNNLLTSQDSYMAIFDGFEQEMQRKILSCEKRISEYEHTIAKNSLQAFRKIVKGKSSLPEIRRKPKLPDPPLFVPGDLRSIVVNLGKLHIHHSSQMSMLLKQTTPTIVSKFKCPLQGLPKICITKEGDVWFGGDESRELVMVDISGHVLRRRSIKNRPNALVAMDCGDLIISPRSADSKAVSRLLRDGREQHVYDTSPFFCGGVSVTADQKIWICDRGGRVVMTNGDGTNVQQIYNGIGDDSAVHAVEKSDGHIYISDPSHSAVVMVSKGGKVLSTITHTKGKNKLGRPWGFVVDKLDNILCADNINDCVYIIDQNLYMKELVGRSHGIQRPGWLAVDNDNNLWITQSDGHAQVVKYLSLFDTSL